MKRRILIFIRQICTNTRFNNQASVLLPSNFRTLNFASYISKRILKGDQQNKISRPIVRIATVGIAVGVALMILSVAIVKGFQNEVKGMVIGFGSHFQVVSNRDNISKDSQRIEYSQEVYDNLSKIEGVKKVQIFASKPGIIEAKEGLQGVAIKGVGKDYDWTFLQSVVVEGRIIDQNQKTENEIFISALLAKKLKLKLGDKISLYFVNDQNDARQRNFTIVGLYTTGLEDYDSQYVFVDISHVQKLSGWGLEAQILVDTVCNFGHIAIGAMGFGGDGNHRFDWSDSSWRGEGPHFILAKKDTIISVALSDLSGTQSDTAYAKIDFIDDSSTEPCIPYKVSTWTSGGSQSKYIGGYEILIDNYDQLMLADDAIFNALPYDLQTFKITDRSPEIFSWLAMLDINVIIIIILMVVISIVNMTSALLIIILERQQMIGTLKALGAQDKPIVRIFLMNAAFIVGRGLIIGNVIGLGLAWIQYKFEIVSLDPANYYVDKVPISMEWGLFLALDAGAMIICLIALVLPAKYVSRISPIRSIRFS